MMYADRFAIPTLYDRRVRRCAWVVATLAHVGLSFFLLNRWAGELSAGAPVIQPVAVSEILESEIARQLTAEITPTVEPAPAAGGSITTSVEPDRGIVQSVAAQLVNYRDADVGPDPLATVRDKARLLEQISSPAEIERMAESLRGAMGVDAQPVAAPTAETAPVDWADAVQSTAERIERDGVVEIHETFVDHRGGASTMVHVRTATGEADVYAYSMYLIERGKRLAESRCTAEDFNTAAERARPFDVINQFPLLRELHRSAIVPIMNKLARDEEVAKSVPADTRN